MESWRRYLNEAGFGEGQPPDDEFYKKQIKYLEEDEGSGKMKVIFMAGAPGAGKTKVIKHLGLNNMERVDPDSFYEPALVDAGLGKNLAKMKKDYVDASIKLREVLASVLKIEEPTSDKEKWKHKDLMRMWQRIFDPDPSEEKIRLTPEQVSALQAAKAVYDGPRAHIVKQGELFAQAQKDAQQLKKELSDAGASFIIDGTAGFYSRIINQKKKFEEQGYDVGMIFVDVPLETALKRQSGRLERGGRSLDSTAVTRSWEVFNGSPDEPGKRPGVINPFVDRHGKKQEGYAKAFAPNFFRVAGSNEEIEKSAATVKPAIDEFISQVNEDFQQDVKRMHPQWKERLIGKGGNKTTGAPYTQKPSMKRSKSAPPGFGGS